MEWDGTTGKNILWKVQLSKPGNNSPVIWKDKLFLAGADDQGRMIYCLDRNSGNILWQKEVKDIPGSPATIPKATEDAGLSAPTVTTDGPGYMLYMQTETLQHSPTVATLSGEEISECRITIMGTHLHPLYGIIRYLSSLTRTKEEG